MVPDNFNKYLKHRVSTGYNATIIEISKNHFSHYKRDGLSLEAIISLLKSEYGVDIYTFSFEMLNGYLCSLGVQIKNEYLEILSPKMCNLDSIVKNKSKEVIVLRDDTNIYDNLL